MRFVLASVYGLNEADRMIMFDELDSGIKSNVIVDKVLGKFGAISVDGVNCVEHGSIYSEITSDLLKMLL